MKRSKQIDENFLSKIISAAYGDAGIFDKIRIYFDSRKNQEIKKLFDEYKETAGIVKSFTKEECPYGIIKRSETEINKKIAVSNTAGTVKIISIFRSPEIVFAAIAVIIGITALLLIKQPQKEKTYSKADVELAEQQVKQSLAMVGKIFKRTQFKITEDVIGKKVSPPLRKSFEVVNNLFKGG